MAGVHMCMHAAVYACSQAYTHADPLPYAHCRLSDEVHARLADAIAAAKTETTVTHYQKHRPKWLVRFLPCVFPMQWHAHVRTG